MVKKTRILEDFCIAVTFVFLVMTVYVVAPVKVQAYSDTSSMTNQIFFGVWNGSAWTIQGKIDYKYSSELSTVEGYVKAGDYTNAKAALLTYFKNRKTYAVPAYESNERDTNKADLIKDDIFPLSGGKYINTFTVTNSYATISTNVLSGVNASLSENKLITFLLVSRKKDDGAGTFYSKEQAANRPTLEINVDNITYSFTASKDAYVRAGTYKDTNYGKSTLLDVKDHGAPIDDYSRWTYITFDFTSLPSGTPPASAVLKLYGYNGAQTGDKDIMVFRCGDTSWGEDTLTYSNCTLGTYSWQGLSGGTDWSQFTDCRDSQWAMNISRFEYLDAMISEYNATSDTSYSDKITSLMLDFISDQGNYNAGYYVSLDCGIRAYEWAVSYKNIVGSSSMDANANTAILKYMWQMSDWLADPNYVYPDNVHDHNNWDLAHFHDGSNWGVYESRGLYFISVFFPEFSNSSANQSLANSRIVRLSKTSILMDGSCNEDSAGYTNLIVQTLYSYKKTASLNSQMVPESLDVTIKRLSKFIMDMCLPNGFDPNYGDSVYLSMRSSLLPIADEYNDSSLLYFAISGNSGTAPTYTSISYPVGLFAFMRTGWDDNDLYIHFNNLTGNHSHHDLNAVIAYAYGSVLLVDTGRYNYDYNDSISHWVTYSTESHNTIEINDAQMDWGNGVLRDWSTNANMDFVEGSHTTMPTFEHYRDITFIKPYYWIVSDYVTSTSGTNKYEQNWHMMPGANPTLDDNTKKTKTAFSGAANIQIVPADPDSLTGSLRGGYYCPYMNSALSTKFASYVKNVSGNVTFDTILYPTTSNDTNRDVKVTRLTISPNVDTTVATALKVDLNYGNNGNVGYYYLSHESRPSTSRSFDLNNNAYNYDGKMAYIGEDSSGNLQRADIKKGKLLKQGTTILINSTLEISDMSVKWNDTTLEILGNDLKPDTNISSAVAVYAPSATSVKLNGTTISYARSGDLVYAVSQTKVIYKASSDFTSTQGSRNWYYQSYDGSTYSDMQWSSGAWRKVADSYPYVYYDYMVPSDTDNAVRKWVVPVSGNITIDGNVAADPNTSTGGNGTRVKIVKNGTNMWPASGWWPLAYGDYTGHNLSETISVNAGDVIYFIVDANDSSAYDHVLWNPEITLYPGSILLQDDFEDGNANGWTPLTPSRWTVGPDNGDYSYYINTSDYDCLSGDRLGEYSMLDGSNFNNFHMALNARMGDTLATNSAADFAIVFNYQDANNYYFLMINNYSNYNQLFKVKKGSRILIADHDSSTDYISDNNYHAVSIDRIKDAGSIVVKFDGKTIIYVIDNEFNGGKVGIGSYNDSAYFDDVKVIFRKDNDCNGEADEEKCTIYYKDKDNDGQGIYGDSRCLCSPNDLGKYTAVYSGDPDDSDPNIQGTILTGNMNLPSGWSMISLPLVPKNASVSSLYPASVAIYGYQKGIGYIRIKEGDNLEEGKGYWILLNDAKTYSITGAIIDEYNLSVQDGWNMIGGCTSGAKASGENCNISVIYGYEQEFGYKRVQKCENLKPGKGYWILLEDATDRASLTVQGMM